MLYRKIVVHKTNSVWLVVYNSATKIISVTIKIKFETEKYIFSNM